MRARFIVAATGTALALLVGAYYAVSPRRPAPGAETASAATASGERDPRPAGTIAAGLARPSVPRLTVPTTGSIYAEEVRLMVARDAANAAARGFERTRLAAMAEMGLPEEEAHLYYAVADKMNEQFAAKATPAIDEALEVARTETDPAKRKAAHTKAREAMFAVFAASKVEIKGLYRQPPPTGKYAHPVGMLDGASGTKFSALIRTFGKKYEGKELETKLEEARQRLAAKAQAKQQGL